MERSKSRDDVAVFVDFENVYVSVREKFDAQPNFELIMDRCEDYGRIVIARAYADWYRYPRVTSALFANGVEPMYVPTYYYDREVGRTGRPIKNSVDIHLCIDAMRTLYTQAHIDKFVLVTGDRDFIPLVNAIRQHGKDVIIIGIGGAASAHLAQSSDEFIFYEQIADLKSPQQQRQEVRQEQPRPERRDRDGGERRDRERGDGNGKVDRRDRERQEQRQAPAPVPEAVPEAAPEPELVVAERSVYDTLVDAINLARQRGFVSNLGSLKVLMRELDSGFNESKVKDANGRPFTKFKDFVKEAERQGRVQIFTNGTVTEVFLAGEDPMRVSQFAEDLASQQVERELENELAAEEARNATPEFGTPEAFTEVDTQQPEAFVADNVEQPTLPDVIEAVAEQAPAVEYAPQPAQAASSDEPATEPATDTARPTFGDREWQIFRGSMSQFTEPVRFAEIFSALRGLRNQEVFDLTNNELKELVKQAINKGMLQRTGRGARAYYRLSSQYRIPQDELRTEQAIVPTPAEPARQDATQQTSTTIEESAAGIVAGDGLAPAARRRRGRAYDVFAPPTEGERTDSDAATATAEASGEAAPAETEAAAPEQEAETAPKPRRNRRKKQAQPEATQPEAQADESATATDNERGADEETGDAKAGNGTKKRRNRRKKPARQDETGGETVGSDEQ